jgi:hypothetical protein
MEETRWVKVWPDYSEYTKKIDREIPIVVLERVWPPATSRGSRSSWQRSRRCHEPVSCSAGTRALSSTATGGECMTRILSRFLGWVGGILSLESST